MITKKKYWLAMIATIALFTGCNEVITPDLEGIENNTGEGHPISLVATMPEEGPQARVATSLEEKAVALVWEQGDIIQLSFIQGLSKIKREVTVTNITEEGKKATFNITLPEGITGPFDLYGVYGGGGIDDIDPALAKLPENPGNTTSLEEVDFMLYFVEKGLNTSDIQNLNVSFQHLGSLFAITVKNTGYETLTNLTEARLTSTTTGWVYNAGAGGGTFNLEEGTLGTTPAAGDYISFTAEKNTLARNESVTFWGWYPFTATGTGWPALNLQLQATPIAATTLPKGAKTALAGKSYWFYATYYDGVLEFKDESELDIYLPVSSVSHLNNAIDILERSDNYIKFQIKEHSSTNPVTNPHLTDPYIHVNLRQDLPADATLLTFEYKSDYGLKWGGTVDYYWAPWPYDNPRWSPISDNMEVFLAPAGSFGGAMYYGGNLLPATNEWKEVILDISSKRGEHPEWGKAGQSIRIDFGNYSLNLEDDDPEKPFGTIFELRNIEVRKPS